MKRIQHTLVQGTPEWHAFRAEHDGASEAPAMLGLSKCMTRNDLLRMKSTGIAPEVDAAKQGLFDAGHAAEALARPIAEEILGEELYPATYSYGRLSASCDGLTMGEDIAWEHKLYRADLAASVERDELPDEYMAQCQQIMLVTGTQSVLFMVSDGNKEHCVSMTVKPDPKWFKRIEDGWKQFRADLAAYQPVEVLPAAVAAPTMQLPALSIQVTGSIALVDNLKVFGERLESFISAIDKNPSDDQAFADAEAAIKTLGTAETALEAAKASALAQTASIDEMTRTVALYAGQARNCRLMLTKLVKDRKESIRVEIVQGGKDAFSAHVAGLNKQLGKSYISADTIPAHFANVIKGKKTVASLRDAVDTELARAKIEANEIAGRITININTLREHAEAHKFLFADTAQIVFKQCDDFLALVKMRISEHKAAEEKRLEAERARIRAEEQAKLLREQQERERRERIEAEQAKEKAAAQASPSVAAAVHVAPAPAAPISSATPASQPSAAPPSTDKVAGVASGTRQDKSRGLYGKFSVARLDGRDDIGDKHYGCEYFVLDLTHDRHAIAALFAYADSCQTEYPQLAKDLRAKAVHMNEPKAA